MSSKVQTVSVVPKIVGGVGALPSAYGSYLPSHQVLGPFGPEVGPADLGAYLGDRLCLEIDETPVPVADDDEQGTGEFEPQDVVELVPIGFVVQAHDGRPPALGS